MDNSTFYVVKELNTDDVYEMRVIFPSEEDRANPNFDPLYWVCYWAAKTYAFEDLTGDCVVCVCCNGRHLIYSGWQPGMVYEFEDVETGEIVWRGCFESWEH